MQRTGHALCIPVQYLPGHRPATFVPGKVGGVIIDYSSLEEFQEFRFDQAPASHGQRHIYLPGSQPLHHVGFVDVFRFADVYSTFLSQDKNVFIDPVVLRGERIQIPVSLMLFHWVRDYHRG